MKLSETLKKWSNSEFEDSLAEDARALEERCAALDKIDAHRDTCLLTVCKLCEGLEELEGDAV